MLNKIIIPDTHKAHVSYKDQNIDFEPFNTCPICGKNVSPSFLFSSFTTTANSENLIPIISKSHANLLFECPSCHNGILVYYNPEYKLSEDSRYISEWKQFKIKSIFPTPVAQFTFKEIISTVSPSFKEIYIQALQAKLDGKNELVGIGYRKAIEFLIKDYLLYVKHDKSDKIPALPLGDCIKLIDNQKIHKLAKASTWLGNDETHYVRRHTDKDLTDLEKFLEALVYYITFEITVDEADSFIGK